MEYNPPVPCDLPIAEQLTLGRKNGYLGGMQRCAGENVRPSILRRN